MCVKTIVAFPFSVRYNNLYSNQVTWIESQEEKMKLWLRFNEMNTRVQCFHVCVHCGGGLRSRPLYILLPTLKYPLPSDFAPPLYTSVYSLYDWTLIENMCSLFTQTFARLPFLVLYILVLLLRNPEVAFHDDRWLCRRRISA